MLGQASEETQNVMTPMYNNEGEVLSGISKRSVDIAGGVPGGDCGVDAGGVAGYASDMTEDAVATTHTQECDVLRLASAGTVWTSAVDCVITEVISTWALTSR